MAETILIRISGLDQPGITSDAMSILGGAQAVIQDIEQYVVRGRIALEIVAVVPPGNNALKDMLLLGWERGLDVDFELVEAPPTPSLPSLIVSVIGPELGPSDVGKVAAAISKANGNIERIQRLAKNPVWCYEFEVHGGDADEMRSLLVDTAADNPRSTLPFSAAACAGARNAW